MFSIGWDSNSTDPLVEPLSQPRCILRISKVRLIADVFACLCKRSVEPESAVGGKTLVSLTSVGTGGGLMLMSISLPLLPSSRRRRGESTLRLIAGERERGLGCK